MWLLKRFSPDFMKAEYIRVEKGHPFDLGSAEKMAYF